MQTVATATWEFADAYLSYLVAWLQTRNHRVSPDLCDEAAGIAIHNFMKAPECFDPTRGTKLLAFLRLAAQRDLLNLLETEKRHAHQPLEENIVEFHAAGRKYQGRQGALNALCDWEDEQERLTFLQQVRASLKEPDRQVFDLMLAGERDTPVFATALGVTHLSPKNKKSRLSVRRTASRCGSNGGGERHEQPTRPAGETR